MSELHPATGSVRPAAPQGVAVEGFETLLSVGRRRGYLTQDDLILVLQAVELTYDVIEDVVARVRAEGIEYVEERRNGAAAARGAALRRIASGPAGAAGTVVGRWRRSRSWRPRASRPCTSGP